MEESYNWHPAFISLDEEAVRQETEWLYVDVESCRLVTTGGSAAGREEPETEMAAAAAASSLANVGADVVDLDLSGAHVLSSSSELEVNGVCHCSPAPQPQDSFLALVRCYECGQEPRDAVESPCCGEVLCWECLVREWPTTCPLCNASVTPGAYKPAKAIERLIKLVKEWKTAPPALPPPPPPPPPVDKEIPAEPLDLVFSCPDECGAILPLDELDEHMAVCQAEEACPNGCYAQLKRREVRAHLADECPLTFVQCRFGCEEQMLRREADEHANDNLTKHMNHLLTRIEDQEKKMTELHQRMNESWANPERAVAMIREWVTACSRSARGSLNGYTWPLAVLVLMLACVLLLLPGLFVLELVLRNLPAAFAPLIVTVGATVSVGIVTFLFSIYCALC